MSYTPPPSGYLVPPAPGAGPRPGTVTASSMLLYLTSALLVLSAALSVYTYSALSASEIEDIYRQGGADPSMAESSAAIVMGAAYGGAVLTVVIAVLFVILGLFVNRGKQWARVTTWVIGGIGLCCCGFGLAGQAMTASLTGGSAGGIDQEEITKRLSEQMPDWTTGVSIVITVVQLLALLAVIILLALPPSNNFFRKPAPEWTPPAYPV
ncbi:hypothetical protein ACFQY4_45185 [Catellatospora bangladeshensis]|uniref:Uncharacterized protein n=1 Tax=Catellatospora bangladeshensis TaxID=310355 RepID=A0A8J3JWM7_9ACTN|nr:hypothetical protein [Catellatospora bangladeshensis]GIF84444.1 hypothetical protein Cba03nite_57930 [Catellatospora bangladeshensis]